ncbi:MAG: hypothetical protein FWD98_02325, partial [Defluviitaleaceae bacterium]|nr:hypothetical protein [Defluviitaleaceae bacterium]
FAKIQERDFRELLCERTLTTKAVKVRICGVHAAANDSGRETLRFPNPSAVWQFALLSDIFLHAFAMSFETVKRHLCGQFSAMRRRFLLANPVGSRRRQLLALRKTAAQIRHLPVSKEV